MIDHFSAAGGMIAQHGAENRSQADTKWQHHPWELQRNGKYGFGVTLDSSNPSRAAKYKVRVRCKTKVLDVGRFRDAHEARLAYDQAVCCLPELLRRCRKTNYLPGTYSLDNPAVAARVGQFLADNPILAEPGARTGSSIGNRCMVVTSASEDSGSEQTADIASAGGAAGPLEGSSISCGSGQVCVAATTAVGLLQLPKCSSCSTTSTTTSSTSTSMVDDTGVLPALQAAGQPGTTTAPAGGAAEAGQGGPSSWPAEAAANHGEVADEIDDELIERLLPVAPDSQNQATISQGLTAITQQQQQQQQQHQMLQLADQMQQKPGTRFPVADPHALFMTAWATDQVMLQLKSEPSVNSSYLESTDRVPVEMTTAGPPQTPPPPGAAAAGRGAARRRLPATRSSSSHLLSGRVSKAALPRRSVSCSPEELCSSVTVVAGAAGSGAGVDHDTAEHMVALCDAAWLTLSSVPDVWDLCAESGPADAWQPSSPTVYSFWQQQRQQQQKQQAATLSAPAWQAITGEPAGDVLPALPAMSLSLGRELPQAPQQLGSAPGMPVCTAAELDVTANFWQQDDWLQ